LFLAQLFNLIKLFLVVGTSLPDLSETLDERLKLIWLQWHIDLFDVVDDTKLVLAQLVDLREYNVSIYSFETTLVLFFCGVNEGLISPDLEY
jgi:hypothetical protein